MKKTLIRAILPNLQVEDLVSVILDTDVPFAQNLPYIMINDRYSLKAIKEETDTQFVLDAMNNGRYRKDDRYFFYSEDACEICSFTTTEEAIAHSGLEELAEYVSCQLEDDAEETNYKTSRKILRDYARMLLDELNDELRSDPCEIELIEL